jgi:lipopolysaccharide export system permease protein
MTLYLYISRYFLMWFLVILFGILGIIFIFDTIELLRRTADKPDITFGVVLTMGFLNLPDMAQKTMPFVALFSSMLTLWRLTRNQELVVVRAVGVSVWEFLLPILVTTVILSLSYLFVINPLGAIMKKAYMDMENKYIERGVLMDISSAGLWLRQSNEDENYLLHADVVSADPFTLKPLIAFIYNRDGTYLGRIDAEKAELVKNQWVITNAWHNMKGVPPEKRTRTYLPTQLSMEKIQESMSPPSTVSFWDLPGFIAALESTGFPGIRHRLQLFSLVIQPIFLCAMVLFAACFSLGMARRGGAMASALAGLFIGSFAFGMNDMIATLGVNQTLPTWVAAFATPLIALSGGAAALFHLEDG